ncbi:MAG: uroporphyrinogen decarboxylase family protein, partial [Anaerolineae bacterium]|nr:uroporphyrinogen decarboxylase family protein [Anaerolineae bacterium]
ELIEHIADWMLQSLDNLLSAPVDAVMLTDDYADQRGMIFGIERFRRFFKPHWRRIFARIRKAGVYSLLHVCGNAAPAVPDLLECGLDCLESLQPEAMDIYRLKREYGRDIRLWGGLGAQSTLLDSPEAVRLEVRRLKREMGRGGGYVLAGAKGIMEDVPVANVVAYLEEASATE